MQGFPALVLNADFRPVSLFPLSLRDVKRAVKNVFEGTVSVVSEYDRVIRSPSFEMRLPSVIALRTYIRPSDYVAFTSDNIFLRDRYRCQYCGERRSLTVDHVHPLSKGGTDCWENCVAACDPCNARKGDTVGLFVPMKVPRKPTSAEMLALKRAHLPRYIHPTWKDFLPADMAA